MDQYTGTYHEKSNEASDIIAKIDQRVKNYTDGILSSLGSTSSRLSDLEISISSRLSELETRTSHLENSVNDLKFAVANNSGGTEGKLKQLESIMREIQNGVQHLREKQDIVETQQKLSKLQIPVDTQQRIPHPTQVEYEQHQAPPQPQYAPREQDIPYTYQPAIQHPPPGGPPPSLWQNYQMPPQSMYPPHPSQQQHSFPPRSEEMAPYQQSAQIHPPGGWPQASYAPRTDAYDPPASNMGHAPPRFVYREPPVFLPPPSNLMSIRAALQNQTNAQSAQKGHNPAQGT